MSYIKDLTLLYVEDEPDAREIFQFLLQDYVKELYLARNGKEGIAICKEKNIDIIITDIMMPKMNGIEMSRILKEENSLQHIAILTAFDETEYLHDSVDIGIDKYILKPIQKDNLFVSLEAIGKCIYDKQENEKNKRVIQLQGKLAAMGEMIGNIAHQWRQPLTVMNATVMNLQATIDLGNSLTNEEILSCSENISKQGRYLSQTIEDFRDFIRGDTRNKENFFLNDTVEKTKSLVKDAMNNNFIKLITETENIKLFQNENQLIQVLLNILNNAKDTFKFSNIQENRMVFLTTTLTGNKVNISIKDNAGGIVEELINEIFNPYFTTKDSLNGTGLGLYMSQNIISKQFDGTIEVFNREFLYENKRYRGAEFVISFSQST